MVLRNADYTWKERVLKLCLIENITEGVDTDIEGGRETAYR